jgi:hypothetical protein
LERASVSAIIEALNSAGVRYLIAGGLAVVAHGHVRFTADLDLFLDLEKENLSRAVGAFAGLGYRPRAPVPLADFIDAAKRDSWIRDKGLTVFSLFSPTHAATEIDIFVEAPCDFEPAFARCSRMEIAPSLIATFVSFEDLLAMKKRAGRPEDIEDINRLRALRDSGHGD